MLWKITLPLLLTVVACSTATQEDPCSGEGISAADEALAAGSLMSAKSLYEQQINLGCKAPLGEQAESGLSLLDEAPSSDKLVNFLRLRGWTDWALDILLARYSDQEEAKSLLCMTLHRMSEGEDIALSDQAKRQAQYVACLQHLTPPEPLRELRGLARLTSLASTDAERIGGLGVDNVSELFSTCLQPPTLQPTLTAACDDPFPVGSISRLAGLTAAALELSEEIPDAQDSATCLRKVGLDACFRALQDGCSCAEWQIVQPALWDALGPSPGAATIDEVRDSTLIHLEDREPPWICDRDSIMGLRDDPTALQALRLLYVTLAQASSLGSADVRSSGPKGAALDTNEDFSCAHRISCELGDLAGLASFFPGHSVQECPVLDEDVCGDGELDKDEECDDGNRSDSDACTNKCKLAECGDGFVHKGHEACDDNNRRSNDGCSRTCALEGCGDGTKQRGEECDDGNTINSDQCTNECKIPRCGDGIVHPKEECDDGNKSNQDRCTNLCKKAICGDGFVEYRVEECDPRALLRLPAHFRCTRSCKLKNILHRPRPARFVTTLDHPPG